jgi:sterol desaturase/sphingolipid hydroxylase (fatty acid hydroxylase superfamily)
MTLPSLLVICATLLFLVAERAVPGRPLPNVKGWYWRALFVNLCQLGITLATARLWDELFGRSVFHLARWNAPPLEGLAGWFVGTFFFYWWHVIRHKQGFWLVFHQIHHSPSRIEVATSFYKHPIEILSDSILSALVLYPLLGCSMPGAFWYNFFAATGEYFYHANVRSPRWLRFLIQTPELHSIHHQLDVHRYNFGDLPLWDRVFGTYKDTTEFVPRCGFPAGAERRLLDMLAFKDVYREDAEKVARASLARE